MRIVMLVASLWLGAMSAYGKIVFESGRNGNLDIYSMNSDGTGQTRLTHNEADDFEAAWSPNGRQIVFESERDGDLEIYVMDADGENQRNLTQHPALDGSPDWSPDGLQITFTSERINGLSLFVMNANGTNRWQVSEPIPHAGMFMMGWSPDGKKILYTAAIDLLVMKSSLVIATLHPRRHEAVKHERVPLPKKMHIYGAAWGADGKSVLVTLRTAPREEGGEWNIYRFRLPDGPLIQLTDHPATDGRAREWNPRLPVSPQGLTPKRWGEIKSNSHSNRGHGRDSIPPMP